MPQPFGDDNVLELNEPLLSLDRADIVVLLQRAARQLVCLEQQAAGGGNGELRRGRGVAGSAFGPRRAGARTVTRPTEPVMRPKESYDDPMANSHPPPNNSEGSQ